MKLPARFSPSSPRLLLLAGAGLLVVGLLLGTQVPKVLSGDDTQTSLRKLEEAFYYISRNYVDRVDSAGLAEDAVLGMIQGLDPHSTYISAEEMRGVRESFDASFEGIGIYYEFIEGADGRDTLAVLMPIVGGPSEEVGLQAGDRILQIDDTTALGFTSELVQRYLKGPKGSKVRITVQRHGFNQPLTFTITRDTIPIETVVAAYMVDDKTGYIKLQRFARTTYDEFMQAMNDLRRQGMERLVLDLRDNAGGFMDQAVRICDEFLSSNQLIVYTESRHASYNQDYRAKPGGAFEDKPLIILVNENSASASEIVAGAMQDHDRALLVGRRTFGKGLVQQQFSLTDGSVLQMTISRYHTPSGRMIQTPYTRGQGDEAYYEEKYRELGRQFERLRELGRTGAVPSRELGEELPDSLRYQTDRGRTVYGGGGILPDYLVLGDSVSATLRTVIRQNLDSDFARQLIDEQGEQLRAQWQGRQRDFVRSFQIDDATFQRFLRFSASRGVEVVDQMPTDSTVAEKVFVRQNLQANRADIEVRIKAYLARRLYGVDAFYPVVQQIDPTFQEALKLWTAVDDLAVVRPGR